MPGGPKQKRSKDRSAASDTGISDPRFAKIQTDAVYRLPSKKQSRVALDSRFAPMLQDEEFTSTAKVDRYGRKLAKSQASRNLERLYKVEKSKSKRKPEASESEDEDDEDDEEEEEEGGVSIAADEEVERELARIQGKHDPARDGGYAESSSEEDTSDEESDLEDVDETGLAAEVEDVPDGEVSSRLAVVNLDWDNIRAVDLMAVLQSFVPTGQKIKKVAVYPSEFGKERIEREKIEGPPKELFQRKPSKKDDFSGFSDEEDESGDQDEVEDDEDENEDERIRKSLVQEDQGEDFDSDQLRKYQLERLRYYYAVVDCSSEKCALEIYRGVDGLEYLSTANFFDLRFIPDDTDFSDDKPRDSCREVPEGYAPNDFSTDALRNSKVKLTWDADDVNRKESQKRAFSRAEIDENDLKAYLASDSSDDDQEPEVEEVTLGEPDVEEEEPKLSKKEAERQRMRKLLGLSAVEAVKKSKDEPVGDMQVTFSSALGAGTGSVFENEPPTGETTAEKYMRKERERKARRKEKMKAARGEDGEGAVAEPEVPAPAEDLGFDDPFFTEPTIDQKAAKAARKEEKRKKRAEREAEEARNAASRADLEKLMADDSEEGTNKIQHFDIDELKKAEKAAKRKGKKGKLRASEKAALQARAKDTFEMNVEDPRFKGVFEDPSLALDPNSARFSKTEGMQKLLEAGRKKRSRDMDGDMEERGLEKKKKKSSANAGGEDLTRLVRRVKGKR